MKSHDKGSGHLGFAENIEEEGNLRDDINEEVPSIEPPRSTPVGVIGQPGRPRTPAKYVSSERPKPHHPEPSPALIPGRQLRNRYYWLWLGALILALLLIFFMLSGESKPVERDQAKSTQAKNAESITQVDRSPEPEEKKLEPQGKEAPGETGQGAQGLEEKAVEEKHSPGTDPIKMPLIKQEIPGSGSSGSKEQVLTESMPSIVAPLNKHSSDEVDQASAQRMFFEGRWVEKAVKQKRGEILARRAYAETTAVLLQKFPHARLESFESPNTVVTTMKSDSEFLAVGVARLPDETLINFTTLVTRDSEAHWRVVQFITDR